MSLLKVKNFEVVFIPTEREDVGGFLFKYNGKRVAFCPCDVKNIEEEKLKDLDLLVHECGWFPKDPQGKVLIANPKLWSQEIRFTETIKRVQRIKPKESILIGLEEVYQRSYDDYKKLERQFRNLNISFAHDGMEVDL